MCEHEWKKIEGTKSVKGTNCIRECIRCGLTERFTHFFNSDGKEVYNRTMLSGPC